MKVKELIEILKDQDQESEVLSGDHDHYFYDIMVVRGGVNVCEGREVDCEEGATLCVVFEP